MDQFLLPEDEDIGPSNENSIVSMSLQEWTALDKKTLGKSYSIFALDEGDAPRSAEPPNRIRGDLEMGALRANIIRPPNASDGDLNSVLKLVNTRSSNFAVPFALGRMVVDQGSIQVVRKNGVVQILPPGRYRRSWSDWFMGARRSGLYSLRDSLIQDGTFTMVRVQRGQYGLAVENGKPVLLNEGLHVYNSPLFRFVSFKPMDAEYIQHMSYHIIRVTKGYFGKIWEQGRAKLLPEGLHTVDSTVFSYAGSVDSSDPHIHHGSITILQVPKGQIGKVFESKLPTLLHEGLHIFDSPTLEFTGMENKQSISIKHGTISRFRVQKGEMGLCWMDNHPLLVETAGTYQVDSANFAFEGAVAVTEKLISLGARKIVTVYSGEVGISYNAGQLQILSPGRHFIESAGHFFDDFLSTQQRSLRLRSSKKDDLMLCDTKDLVKIGIRADVFFRISDPEKTIIQVGRQALDELVMETSIATLTNIMRSTALNEIAQNTMPSTISEKAVAEECQKAEAHGEPSAPLFFDRAHDQFLNKLHDDFHARYGVEITNIRIEQFKIMDEALASSISQQAITTAQTESKLANLKGQTEIATAEKEREGRIRLITAQADASTQKTAAEAEVNRAQAEAQSKLVRTEAEVRRTKLAAEAEASAVKIRAEATVAEAEATGKSTKIRAEASVSEAEAGAQAIRLRGEAESERAAKLSKAPLGAKLALLGVYGETVKRSNDGVQKVVYVDPSTTSQANPFSLLTLQSLNRDLQGNLNS